MCGKLETWTKSRFGRDCYLILSGSRHFYSSNIVSSTSLAEVARHAYGEPPAFAKPASAGEGRSASAGFREWF